MTNIYYWLFQAALMSTAGGKFSAKQLYLGSVEKRCLFTFSCRELIANLGRYEH